MAHIEVVDARKQLVDTRFGDLQIGEVFTYPGSLDKIYLRIESIPHGNNVCLNTGRICYQENSNRFIVSLNTQLLIL